MFTSFGVYDVDAAHDGNGKSMGCQNGNAKNNPHCNGSGGTSSIQFTACDLDEKGSISGQELVEHGNQQVTGAAFTLDQAMNNWMVVDEDGNGIDNRTELRNLNKIIGDLGFTCS